MYIQYEYKNIFKKNSPLFSPIEFLMLLSYKPKNRQQKIFHIINTEYFVSLCYIIILNKCLCVCLCCKNE